MAALEFIRLLEDRGLLAPDVISEITKQVKSSKTRITPEAIARLLVDNGQLTRFQATKLISELNAMIDRASSDPTTSLRGGRPVESLDHDSVEDLLPVELRRPTPPSSGPPSSGPPSSAPPSSRPPSSRRAVKSPTERDSTSELGNRSERPVAHSTNQNPPTLHSADDDEILDAEVLDAEIVEEDEFVDAYIEDDIEEIVGEVVAAPGGSQGTQSRGTKARPTSGAPSASTSESGQRWPVASHGRSSAKNLPKKNAWDSFRVLGIGGILAFLLVLLVPLLWWFSQGAANEAFEQATMAYEARDYNRAAKAFREFAYSYPRDDQASKARVLSVLAVVREATERVPDPQTSLEVAQVNLPAVVSEKALVDHRSDLTDILLKIGEKFISQIDGTRDLNERITLVSKLQELALLVADPQYVGGQERSQSLLRIQNLEEGISRANRGILRDTERNAAVETMKSANAARDVQTTYITRRNLVRKHPSLEDDPALRELLNDATVLQQSLVVDLSDVPSPTVPSSPDKNVARVLLTNQNGAPSGSSPTTVYLTVKGALVAVRASDGELLWRKYFGRDWSGGAQAIDDEDNPGVLVHLPEQHSLQRLSEKDGTVEWETKFASTLSRPLIDGDECYITTGDGAAFCLQIQDGNPVWAKKFPQEISVPVGGGSSARKRYVVGHHSNLYALSNSSGACEEVEYLGHQPTTIAIAPIWMMNHLFVFENAGPDYSFMRIFETDGDGLNITPSKQLPIRFHGHFVVAPQIEGRRFVITTNLGEVAVFEIDPNHASEKVQKIAGSIEREVAPRVNWPLLVGTDLYLASNRLALYEVQVSSQKLSRSWQKDDRDEFTQRPIHVEDTIIHARMVQGNLGVRVSSIDRKSGQLHWENDLSVPVTALGGTPPNWTALTAQGAVFRFNIQNLRSQSILRQSENLGRNRRWSQFEHPVHLPDGQIVAFNFAKEDEFIIVDPSKPDSVGRRTAIQFNGALPIAEPAVFKNWVVVPLSNGQITLVDPVRTQIVGTPFQPPMEPDRKVNWLNPLVLPSSEQVIVVDPDRAIYKLTIRDGLILTESESISSSVRGRVERLGNQILLTSQTDTHDQLHLRSEADLKTKRTISVKGRVAWGPYRVGAEDSEIAILQTDSHQLLAIDIQGETVWEQAALKTALKGKPLPNGNDFIVGSVDGHLFRISSQDGSVVGQASVHEPLYMSPLLIGQGLLVPTDGGKIVTMPLPSEKH